MVTSEYTTATNTTAEFKDDGPDAALYNWFYFIIYNLVIS